MSGAVWSATNVAHAVHSCRLQSLDYDKCVIAIQDNTTTGDIPLDENQRGAYKFIDMKTEGVAEDDECV